MNRFFVVHFKPLGDTNASHYGFMNPPIRVKAICCKGWRVTVAFSEAITDPSAFSWLPHY